MLFYFSSVALSALCLSTVPFTVATSPSDIPADTPVSQLIAKANAQLVQGNAREAITYFDLAIKKDPSNYLTFFKRGATYLSLGRSSQASKDFDKVLTLKPGFEGALTQRARIKSRNADWDGARNDYIAAHKQGSQDMLDLDEAEGAAKLSAESEKAQDWEGCVSHATTAILVAGTAIDLRQRRARCRFEKGEMQEGISDLSHVLQMNNNLVDTHVQIAAMSFFSLGETEKGITAISRCLQMDQDNKVCGQLRRSLKSIERVLKKVRAAEEKRQLATVIKLLVPSGDNTGLLSEIKEEVKDAREKGFVHARAPEGLYEQLVEKVCEAYTELNNLKKAQPYCDEALVYNPTCLPGLINKAKKQLDGDEFEAAIDSLNKAREAHGESQKIQELMNKAQTLLKRSKQKDYYKVLGVSRDADDRDIKRAFRRLTVLHHPDKAQQNGMTPEVAQTKMAAINEAYEVLSDPELRARFDQGDDPNDPQSGQQPFHGSPFGHGPGGPQFVFRQGGGGGGANFKFAGGAGGGFQFPGGFPFG